MSWRFHDIPSFLLKFHSSKIPTRLSRSGSIGRKTPLVVKHTDANMRDTFSAGLPKLVQVLL